jgi:hypothetical protein
MVYGPTIASKRSLFLQELEYLSSLNLSVWLLCGDFNMIRKKMKNMVKLLNFLLVLDSILL